MTAERLNWHPTDHWNGTIRRGEVPLAYVQIVAPDFNIPELLDAEAQLGQAYELETERLRAELVVVRERAERLERAAIDAAAVMRGLMSDPLVTRHTDLTPEIEAIEDALSAASTQEDE